MIIIIGMKLYDILGQTYNSPMILDIEYIFVGYNDVLLFIGNKGMQA